MADTASKAPLRRYFLFGHPLTHSVSPPIHELVWQQLGLPDCTFALQSTEGDVDLAGAGCTIRSADFAGASVTMPAKFQVLRYVDSVAQDCRIVGSCNCIYLDPSTGARIGTNVDWIGVRHALLGLMPPATRVPAHGLAPAFDQATSAGFVLGAGGATRACIYALHTLGLSGGPIFIANRDPVETAGVVDHFATVGIAVEPIERAADVPALLARLSTQGRRIACATAAIPVHPLATDAEREVYAIAQALFAAPDDGRQSRYFCDLVYDRPQTPFMAMAMAAAPPWSVAPGWQVTLGQAFAAERLWLGRDSLGSACEEAVTEAMRARSAN